MTGPGRRYPVHIPPEPNDPHDGRLIVGPSYAPGPIGTGADDPFKSNRYDYELLGPNPPIDDEFFVDRQINKLRDSTHCHQLIHIAELLIGPRCFSLGVIAGMGGDIISSFTSLFELVRTFVLAELHDYATRKLSWPLHNQTLFRFIDIFVWFSNTFLNNILKKAAQDRDEFVNEIIEVIKDPKAVIEGMPASVAESVTKDWQEFQQHLNANTLFGRFRAGMIFGKLLIVVLEIMTGIGGAVKIGAKMTAKFPRLIKLSKSVNLKAIRKGVSRNGGSSAGGGSVGCTSKITPSNKQRSSKAINKKNSSKDSDSEIVGPKTTPDPDKASKKDLKKKYKNKPPTKEEISLAKKPGKSAKQIAARKKVASHFYEKQGFDPDTIPAHLEGVNLDKPVEVVKLKEGTRLKQLQIPGTPQGNYYTTPDTPADKLGISLKVKHRDTGEIIERLEGDYIVKGDTDALSSTTAGIVDNWSIPGENITTKGGGTQYFSTDKISIGPVD